MDERPDLYEQIVNEYYATGSVRQVVRNLGTNTIKVRRVLITEGLWESETSRNVGALHYAGKSTKEIAEELCISEKNVQSYLPYTRGAYGGNKSGDATRSGEYRERMKKAADSQVTMKHSGDINDLKKTDHPNENKIIDFPEEKLHESRESDGDKADIPERFPSVLKLRFELVAPYYTRKGDLDMDPVERTEFLENAKAKEGIIREVLVHGEMNLHALHYMIQKLFGWQNTHLHHFSLSETDFDMVTDKQKVSQYLNLCGTLFKFPGSEMDDQFWDDDYMGGMSVKSWLRSKYMYGYRDYSVENSFIRNMENILKFKKRFRNEIRNPRLTLKQLRDIVMFEDGFNTVIEGISVRNIFKTCLPRGFDLTGKMWSGFQDAMIQGVRADYEDMKKQTPKDYKVILSAMQDLIDLRKNIIAIDRAVHVGRIQEITDFYKEDPAKVVHEQRMEIDELERMLEGFLSPGNPGVIPFAEELYYIYDYGDDWCVKITCVDAYTANENYDHSHAMSRMNEDGVIVMDQKIRWEDLQYKSLSGMEVGSDLREKLQTVYLKTLPVCVMADGLNVMDDVGGLYGYQDFLRLINSTLPDDQEEKEDSRAWAKGMGWTGRKTKPENIL